MNERVSFRGFFGVFTSAGACLRLVPVAGTAIIALMLSACDPASLIRAKVPEPIQNLLQFTPPAKASQASGGVPEGPKVDIRQPAANSTHLSGKEVLFSATVSLPQGQVGQPLEIDWTLFKQKEPKPIPLGKGQAVKKALEAGDYRVELSINYQGQRVAKIVPFRVIHALSGKVTASDGQGLTDTEMLLSDLSGKNVISRTQTGRDGAFALEVPREGYYLVMPRKEGFGLIEFFTQRGNGTGPVG